MLIDLQPLTQLPPGIQRDWQAELRPATPTDKGVFRLAAARPTVPKTYEEQRIVVLVVDENGLPLSGVNVAFAFSTAAPYVLSPDFAWQPPSPRRAFVVPTHGSGEIDHIQGSAVRPGEPGGVTVYILEPEYSSDVVVGAGMLADHTGLHLTFQLRRAGVVSLAERVTRLERELGLAG